MQYPILSGTTIRHVEIVALTPERGLLIVVNSAGKVEQHVVELGGVASDLLADLRGRLNAAVVGLTPAQVVERATALVDELPVDSRPLGAAVVAVLLDLVTTDPSTRVVVGGVPNLTRFSDQYETTVRPVLEALEEQVVLLRLLGEVGAAGDVTVRIGHENPYVPLRATSVVASGYGTHTAAWASLGVVGPTRMDYPSTMAAVRAVARYVGRFLTEG